MVTVPGRSANQATPKATAMTPMMKRRMRIIGSGLRRDSWRRWRRADRGEQRALQPLDGVVCGQPGVSLDEPALKSLARGAGEPFHLFHRQGKVALFQM